MSDRFDHTLERKLDRSAASDDGSAVLRRIEVITGTGRRREWSTSDKTCILLESLEPGANVSEVARRNGLSPQQLFGWRRESRVLIGADPPRPVSSPVQTRPVLSRTASAPKVPGSSKPHCRERQRPADKPAFAPVVIATSAVVPVAAGRVPTAVPSPRASEPPDRSPPDRVTTEPTLIEIMIGDAVVRVSGEVDVQSLALALKAVRRAS